VLNVWGVDYPLSILVIIGGAIAVAVVGTIIGMLYRGVDRKVVAHMQGRIGPPIVQPFRDMRKLLMKESIIPEGAVAWLFKAAPVLALIASALLLLYIPLFGQQSLLGGTGDTILLLYLLIIPSLAFVLGGFASSSPYATVGAQREMVVMMSYEFPLAVTIVAIAWRVSQVTNANPFMLATLAENPIWNIVGPIGIIGVIILLLTLIVVTIGEVAKIPFDVAEAETEIAGGLLVEYSGRNLLMFYLADIIKAFAMISLIVALFFPYNLSALIGMGAGAGAVILDIIFFLVKVFVLMFISVMLIRTGMARFKISQASWVYIVAMTLIGLVGLILIWLDLVV
jgi:formate hydrogenlyase subunit 4